MESFWSFLRDLDDLNTLDAFVTSHRQIRRVNKFKRRLDPLIALNDEDFKMKYRFSKDNMRKLLENVRDDLEGENTGGHIPVELQVMAAIRHWGLNELPEITADIHGLNQQAFSKICRRVSAAFASKSSRYIRMPVTLAEKEKVINDFHALGGFPQVIGAIDCAQIKIKKIIVADEGTFANTEEKYLLNTQVVSDATLKIRDIDCRLRSNTTDSQIFRESRIKERFEQNEFRGRLLGDGAYACTPYLYTPILRPSTKKELAYNNVHIVTHSPVKKCFHIWRKRFRILQDVMKGSFGTVKTTVVALAVLHNMAIEMNDSHCEFEDLEENCNIRNSAESPLPAAEEEEHLGEMATSARSAFIEKYF